MHSQLSIPKTLLFSGTVPGEPGVGGIILRDIMDAIDPGDMPSYLVMRRDAGVQKAFAASRAPAAGTERRYETGYRPVRGLPGELIAKVAHDLLMGKQHRRLSYEATAFGQRQTVSQVWAILDSPSVIGVARRIAESLQVPLKVLVWDAPELLASQLQMDRWSRARMLREFDQILSTCDALAVVGETMQNIYRQRYARDSVIVRHGIDAGMFLPIAREPRRTGPILIGYAGSITADDAFRAFICALDHAQWTIAGRPVILRLAGVRYLLASGHPQRIEYFGSRTVPEVIQLLSECDLNYLPQPFDPAQRPLAELSFPTKLSTYVATGIPTFLHAPGHASVVPFHEQYPIGSWCASLSPAEIARALEHQVADQQAYAGAARATEMARNVELNSEVFLQRFSTFINGPVTKPVTPPRVAQLA